MVVALYRRYRPESFAELIGQSQVTEPLQTALRTGRVNHAYLFSGPRGCGKTTSARILARCLNCAEGPTDTPCGTCPSCVELSRDGGGSLDVVEIDAASHNGVDDARELRERAVFAPARDRYKIFILDEAHMVTPQGFNALLKIVEEPPEHVKFVFATTEPEKVIGTIRSRTHHYPFRLVPPAQLLDYVAELCQQEGVTAEPGVLPLVVRAGGGSVRDTLSLLDQLIAGSETVDGTVTLGYERAVALLGYTHGALLDEVIEAIGAADPAAVFGAIDRVIQTGQDPRRFVEDLLERLRDLIIVAATAGNAASVLRGVPQDELESMARQAKAFGTAELSRIADVVNDALSEMSGATSPRLHLELMAARMLVPAADDTERGALARLDRLERRIGVEGAGAAAPAAPTPPAVPAAAEPARAASAPPAREQAVEPDAAEPAPAAKPAARAGEVTVEQLRSAWPEILEAVQRRKMSAWTVAYTARVRSLDGDVLGLSFVSQNDADAFRGSQKPGEGASELLREAIQELLGLRVRFTARVDEPAGRSKEPAPESAADRPGGGWAVAPSPGATAPKLQPHPEPEPAPQPAAEPAPEPVPAPEAARRTSSEPRRYGEAVVREVLGATFIEEIAIEPRVAPAPRDE